MAKIQIDILDQNTEITDQFDLTEKMKAFNQTFKSSLTPENGAFGVTVVDKGDGLIEETSRLTEGYRRKYFNDGILTTIRTVTEEAVETVRLDDNETEFLKEITIKNSDGKLGTTTFELVPNITVVKGNFTAQIDKYGRPILNKITDLTIKEGLHTNPSSKLKDSSFEAHDDLGHLIADKFGGPATKENVVPQNETVNESQFKQLENFVKNLKTDDNTVDYEVKSNYVGSDKRPSSFEAKVTVDGKEVELPDNLKKIYNQKDTTFLQEKVTDLGERFGIQNEEGLKTGAEAAALTAVVSTVDNVQKYIKGEITPVDMVEDIAKDTAKAGALGYGMGFITSEISTAMSASGCQMINSLSDMGIPAAIVSFGVQSYDSVEGFLTGEISKSELAYDLGENAATVAGSIAAAKGGAALGGAIGSVIPGAGTAVGAAAGAGLGIVGSMVGTVIASEAYATAVEVGSENAAVLANKVQEVASNTIEQAKAELPGKVEDVKSAIGSFANKFNIPVNFA